LADLPAMPDLVAQNCQLTLSGVSTSLRRLFASAAIWVGGDFEVAVGTIIADRPPHGSARALVSACGSYRG
jgi:hypothetical protein